MGTVAINDIVRVVISFSHDAASIAQNVFTFKMTVDAADDEDLLDDLETWCEVTWGGNWNTLSDSNAWMFLVEADVMLGTGFVDRNIGSRVLTLVGGNAGDMSPPGGAAYLQAETSRTKTLGKKYLPFLSEAVIDEGVINAAGLGAMLLAMGVYVDPVVLTVAGVLLPGVLSRVTETFQAFTGDGYFTDVVAYQRRRRPDVGS